MLNLRVVYLAGPGNAFDPFVAWREGVEDPKSSHVTYSSQVFEVCRELSASALVLTTTTAEGPSQLSHGQVAVARRRNWFDGPGRMAYQIRQWKFAREVADDVRRFDANVLIIGDHPYPFLLADLRLRGVKIIQALHCTLWPPFAPRSIANRLTTGLTGAVYPTICDAILSASEQINRQVRGLCAAAGRSVPPLVDFLPHYRPDMYAGIPVARREGTFRVVFVGRVEADKGVFHLLDIAQRLRARGRTDIAFDICGTGGALEPLRARVAQAEIASSFVLHGWCDRDALRRIYGDGHVVVVPTTVNFIEGFNQVVVEALLADRPVITSSACPAVEYVRPAILEVPPDDVAAYEAAILRLADDRLMYERLRAACAPVCRQFLSPETSYASALRDVLSAIQRENPIASKRIPLSSSETSSP